MGDRLLHRRGVVDLHLRELAAAEPAASVVAAAARATYAVAAAVAAAGAPAAVAAAIRAAAVAAAVGHVFGPHRLLQRAWRPKLAARI